MNSNFWLKEEAFERSAMRSNSFLAITLIAEEPVITINQLQEKPQLQVVRVQERKKIAKNRGVVWGGYFLRFNVLQCLLYNGLLQSRLRNAEKYFRTLCDF
jgi:hypothetical protein